MLPCINSEAGIVVEEAAFATLLDEVLGLIYNDWLLNTFRKNLLALDRYDSSQMIADDLLQLAIVIMNPDFNTSAQKSERIIALVLAAWV